MLGVIGFAVAAIAIGSFAYTAAYAYPEVDPGRRSAFSMAFYLLALDMVLWAMVTAIANATITQEFMLASDALLILATGYMLYVSLASEWRPQLVVVVAATAAILLGLRSVAYPSQAYVNSGLLYFNLQPVVRNVVIGILLVTWLPAIFIIARRAGASLAVPGIQQGLMVTFLSIILMTGFFLLTQRPVMIIVAFIGITLLFATAVAINLLLIKAREAERKPHGTRQSAK